MSHTLNNKHGFIVELNLCYFVGDSTRLPRLERLPMAAVTVLNFRDIRRGQIIVAQVGMKRHV